MDLPTDHTLGGTSLLPPEVPCSPCSGGVGLGQAGEAPALLSCLVPLEEQPALAVPWHPNSGAATQQSSESSSPLQIHAYLKSDNSFCHLF